MALPEALAKLRAHLEYLREEGVREIEISTDRLDALRRRASGEKPAHAPRSPLSDATEAATESERLAAIASEIAACRACRLCEKRTRVVPGQGRAQQPDIMFIGEGPGEDEDLQGLAFVGRAGQLLTQIIEAMGYSRDEVFIGNVVKCRPPGNRTPLPDEMAACLHFLERQIDVIRPKLIVALGGTAMKGLFSAPQISITRVRGQWMQYRGIPVMPTFHPAYLLRNPSAKREVWEDMKQVLARLGRPVPARGKPAPR
jgi:DNA polymerase